MLAHDLLEECLVLPWVPDHLASGPVTQGSCSWNKAAFALAQWTGGLEQSPCFLSWASLCAMEQLPLPIGVGKLHYPRLFGLVAKLCSQPVQSSQCLPRGAWGGRATGVRNGPGPHRTEAEEYSPEAVDAGFRGLWVICDRQRWGLPVPRFGNSSDTRCQQDGARHAVPRRRQKAVRALTLKAVSVLLLGSAGGPAMSSYHCWPGCSFKAVFVWVDWAVQKLLEGDTGCSVHWAASSSCH